MADGRSADYLLLADCPSRSDSEVHGSSNFSPRPSADFDLRTASSRVRTGGRICSVYHHVN